MTDEDRVALEFAKVLLEKVLSSQDLADPEGIPTAKLKTAVRGGFYLAEMFKNMSPSRYE